MLNEELTVISRLQKHLKDNYHAIGENMMAGAVDNMEKYKYMLGQAHAYVNILQEISNLLNPKKEDKNEQRDDNVIQFGNTED
jgi:chitinase|tara:strand:- start:421 stop:669 length:249 start_codon:yes stop_codon:yes gene_type:complete